MTDFTDFAKLREQNIAKNKALLEQLELKEAVEGLDFAISKPQPKQGAKPVQSTRDKRRRATAESVAPRRQSSRLKSVTVSANETREERRKREAEEERKRVLEEQEREESEERQRKAKRPRHENLDFIVMGDDMTPKELRNLMETFISCSRTKQSTPELSEEAKAEEAQINDLKEQYRQVKIVSRAKVTQDRVYCSLYHSERTKDLIFFGDKHGQLGIWDALAPPEEVEDEDGNVIVSEEGGKIFRLQPHWPATSKSSISCIKLDPLDARVVYTSAYDCTLRSISFESGMSREVFSIDDMLISSFDLLSNGHELWISDTSGGITRADLREKRSRATRYQLADQKIGCVSVNPVHPQAILASSNNRSLTLWDARKLSSLPVKTLPTPPPSSPAGPKTASEGIVEIDLDDVNSFRDSARGKGTLLAKWDHHKSVSSAYWDPSGTRIVSTSYDDTIRLWNVNWKKLTADKVVKSFQPLVRLRHNCQTGKWLTILKSQWNQNPEAPSHFTVGNMNHSVNVISGTGEVIATLSDSSKITAVQAVSSSHPSIVGRVATGNASGRCVLWA